MLFWLRDSLPDVLSEIFKMQNNSRKHNLQYFYIYEVLEIMLMEERCIMLCYEC